MKLIHFKLLMTAIFWGGTFIAGRTLSDHVAPLLSDHVAPFSAAFLRFVIASIPLLFMTYRMEGRFPPIQKEKVFYLLLLGLTGVFSYNVFFFKGLRLIHAGRASLIIANNPIFITIASFFLFKEKLNAVKIVGILVSVTGAMVAISRGNLQGMLTESFGYGEIFIFLAVLSWVAYSLIGKRVMQDFSAIEAVTYASVTGAIMLFPAALAEAWVLSGITRVSRSWDLQRPACSSILFPSPPSYWHFYFWMNPLPSPFWQEPPWSAWVFI